MSKKNIIIVLVVTLVIFGIYRFGFLGVFWLTTPGDGEISATETALFQKIKEESKAKSVYREPKYDISEPNDTLAYRIIVFKPICTKNQDSLKVEAQKIVSQANSSLNLHKNFVRFEVFYDCSDEPSKIFSFDRKTF